MELNQGETQLKLTKKQLETVINLELETENGLNDLFAMLMNGLMLSERKAFLKDQADGSNKGNGYRRVTRSGIGSKLSLAVPRDRLGVFKPVVLCLLNEQEEKIKDLCFELYGKGLTTRQIEDIVESIYGTNYSKSSISRITTDFSALVRSWLERELNSYYPIVYIDAIHIKVRRDKVASEAFYVLLGLKEDFTREVLGIINIPQESASGWEEVLFDLQKRGVQQVGLFVFDGLTGLESVVGKVFQSSLKQKCTLHFQRNMYKHVRLADRKDFSQDLSGVFDPDNPTYTSEEAIEKLQTAISKWAKVYPKLLQLIKEDNLSYLFTYLQFNYRVRRMIYTTNWIERLNKSFRRTLKHRNALPSPDAAHTLLGFVAMEMTEKKYSYPITNFKFDQNFS